MSRFAIVVEFKLKAGAGRQFVDAVTLNAAASARDEPGCRRFDVLTPRDPEDVDRVVLYEIYDDEAAFTAHTKTPHYAAFKAAIEAIVERVDIQKLDVAENAG